MNEHNQRLGDAPSSAPHTPTVETTFKPESYNGALWHFTSQDSLYPILMGDNGLMAVHTSFMSDTDDCSLSKRMNELAIRLAICEFQLADSRIRVAPDVKDDLSQAAMVGALYPVFAACFATSISEPRLWFEHTATGGFAIEFSPSLSEEFSFLSNGKDVSFGRCRYTDYIRNLASIDQMDCQIAQLEQKIAEKTFSGSDCGFSRSEIWEKARSFIFQKKESLAWERECRLAYTFEGSDVPADRLRFVGGRPFVKLDISKPIAKYVTHIYVSPLGNVSKSLVIASLVGTVIGLKGDAVTMMPLHVDGNSGEPSCSPTA